MSTTNRLTFSVMSMAKPSETLRREFGLWLQKEREARGLSQKFVADKANVTVTQLSRIENGQSGTRRDTVISLAKIIGINEIAALGKFAPESVTQLPEELENIPFDEFDKQDLKEIADFINFKLSQKQKAKNDEALIVDETVKTKEKAPKLKRKVSEKAENREKTEIHLETQSKNDSRSVPAYRFEDGQLIPDATDEDIAHTKKKPSDK